MFTLRPARAWYRHSLLIIAVPAMLVKPVKPGCCPRGYRRSLRVGFVVWVQSACRKRNHAAASETPISIAMIVFMLHPDSLAALGRCVGRVAHISDELHHRSSLKAALRTRPAHVAAQVVAATLTVAGRRSTSPA